MPQMAYLWILLITGSPNPIKLDLHHAFIYRSDCYHERDYRRMTDHVNYECKKKEIPYNSLGKELQDELKTNDFIHDGEGQWHNLPEDP